LEVKDYQEHDVIVQQEAIADFFYIIKSGKVTVYKDNVKVRTITKLDYFGERALIFNDFRTATVVATEGTVT
jgi:cGMP-dependent protein kinase